MTFVMADSIRNEWQTLEQAALTLKCSTRTIHRKISSNQLETRTDDTGRRMVLVQIVTPLADTVTDTSDAENECQTSDVGQGADALARVTDTSDMADMPAASSMMLVVLQNSLDDARQQAGRVRRGARLAWLAAGVMLMAGSAGVVAYVHQTDAHQAERIQLQRDADQLAGQLDRERLERQAIAQDRDQIRDQLEDARIVAAVAQAQADVILTSRVMTPATQPTTRPITSSVIDRIVSIFSE